MFKTIERVREFKQKFEYFQDNTEQAKKNKQAFVQILKQHTRVPLAKKLYFDAFPVDADSIFYPWELQDIVNLIKDIISKDMSTSQHNKQLYTEQQELLLLLNIIKYTNVQIDLYKIYVEFKVLIERAKQKYNILTYELNKHMKWKLGLEQYNSQNELQLLCDNLLIDLEQIQTKLNDRKDYFSPEKQFHNTLLNCIQQCIQFISGLVYKSGGINKINPADVIERLLKNNQLNESFYIIHMKKVFMHNKYVYYTLIQFLEIDKHVVINKYFNVDKFLHITLEYLSLGGINGNFYSDLVGNYLQYFPSIHYLDNDDYDHREGRKEKRIYTYSLNKRILYTGPRLVDNLQTYPQQYLQNYCFLGTLRQNICSKFIYYGNFLSSQLKHIKENLENYLKDNNRKYFVTQLIYNVFTQHWTKTEKGELQYNTQAPDGHHATALILIRPNGQENWKLLCYDSAAHHQHQIINDVWDTFINMVCKYVFNQLNIKPEIKKNWRYYQISHPACQWQSVIFPIIMALYQFTSFEQYTQYMIYYAKKHNYAIDINFGHGGEYTFYELNENYAGDKLVHEYVSHLGSVNTKDQYRIVENTLKKLLFNNYLITNNTTTGKSRDTSCLEEITNNNTKYVVVYIYGHNPQGYQYRLQTSKLVREVEYSSCIFIRKNIKTEDYDLQNEYQRFKEAFSKVFPGRIPIFIGHSYGAIVARYFANWYNCKSISLDGSDLKEYVPYLLEEQGIRGKQIQYLPEGIKLDGKLIKPEKLSLTKEQYTLMLNIDSKQPLEHLVIDYLPGTNQVKLIKVNKNYPCQYYLYYKQYSHSNHMLKECWDEIWKVIKEFISK